MALFAKAQAFMASARIYDDIEKGIVQRADLNAAVIECVDYYASNKSKPDAAKYRTAFGVCQVKRASINCSHYCWNLSNVLTTHSLHPL